MNRSLFPDSTIELIKAHKISRLVGKSLSNLPRSSVDTVRGNWHRYSLIAAFFSSKVFYNFGFKKSLKINFTFNWLNFSFFSARFRSNSTVSAFRADFRASKVSRKFLFEKSCFSIRTIFLSKKYFTVFQYFGI